MLRAIVFIFVFICFSGYCQAQLKKTIAVKTANAPRIDGSLDDEAWALAPAATQFVTNQPSFGLPATDSTAVKILYDNTAIYVGAFLYGDPSLIRKQFTPRDQERLADVDHFAVFIDTYKDRQNAFQFLVTSRNVQSDARVAANIAPDAGIYGDLSWDAVWQSRVTIGAKGWTVEMKIPLFSLRFSNKHIEEWGVQFLRFSRRVNETSFWNPVNPNVSGFVNQFGNLSGLSHIEPPLRLSFSPYVSGGYRETPNLSGSPSEEWLKSGGLDVKYGISESFTLDATVIPDFGQVISDNVVNNISPFEIQFRENRQFFTEGTELFNKADIFYSRRVGREPRGYQAVIDSFGTDNPSSNFDIIKNPTLTRLYNAIKFSGRTADNLGIGVFNAVARSEKARLRNRFNGIDTSITTEELTNYNVFVLDQALKNRSYITFTNTNVVRSGNSPDANVTGADLALYDKSNTFGLILQPRYSRVFDADGGYDGFKNYLEVGKVSGKLQYSLSNDLKTARYDPNDLGFLLAPNELNTIARVSYNIYEPRASLLNQQYSFSVTQSYLFKPFEYQQTELIGTSLWTFRNFWTLQLEAGTTPGWYNDYFELQTPQDRLETPRQKLRRSPVYYLFADGTTDTRKRLYLVWALGAAEGPLPKDPFYRAALETRYRFSDRLTLTAGYTRQYDNGQFGFSFIRDAAGSPILARRKYTDVTGVVSGIYNFTPRMNLTFRARHYWNRILNTNFYDVRPDGNWTERTGPRPSDYNTNYNVFNFDCFYTWDFRLGSRIIFAWKNSLAPDYENYLNGMINKTYFRNTYRMLQIPHGNEITVRFIYFLDYQQFRKRS